ncbi:MAG: hypothetical protein ACHQ9S_25940 [Candidatus Binatia bacterium]
MQLVLPAILAAIVAILGWYVAHRLSTERDVANQRRKLRVQYLIEAYRRLEFVGNRPLTPELAPEFEKAVADIQLFGSLREVQLAREFALGFAKNGTHPLDPLLNELRDDLRAELKLEPVHTNITYLRMAFDKDEPTSNVQPQVQKGARG